METSIAIIIDDDEEGNNQLEEGEIRIDDKQQAESVQQQQPPTLTLHQQLVRDIVIENQRRASQCNKNKNLVYDQRTIPLWTYKWAPLCQHYEICKVGEFAGKFIKKKSQLFTLSYFIKKKLTKRNKMLAVS